MTQYQALFYSMLITQLLLNFKTRGFAHQENEMPNAIDAISPRAKLWSVNTECVVPLCSCRL